MFLTLQGVNKRYDTGAVPVVALRDLNLDVAAGEDLAIVGPSGSGKSTLLSVLGCLDPPTNGSYRLAGEEVAGMSVAELATVRNARIGFVFQGFNLLSRATALENVELPLVYAGESARVRRNRAIEMLASVGLADRHDHLPSQLSGGQQQRVAIARALVNRPDMILADEPTGALDLETGRDVLDMLQKINSEGTTLIIVTHDKSVADRMSRVISLTDGRVLYDSSQTDCAVGTA